MIDHVVKNREARGRWAFGAQHKMAGVDVAYMLDAISPFGKGRQGKSKLTVTKDRPGHVQGLASAGSAVGEFVLSSDGDGRVIEAAVRAPAANFRPTVLMERVSRALEDTPDGMGKLKVREIPGDNVGIETAIRLLVAEGFVGIEHTGNKQLHRSLKPFRE